MTYTRSQITALCREFGPQLRSLPVMVDGAKLLWGLSGCESSFGANCTPRHEPAYDTGGALAGGGSMPVLLASYGSAAACSYGPWQLMLANAPAGTAPESMGDLRTAAAATTAFLTREMSRWRPATLQQVGQMWNAGHPLVHMSPGVAAYCARLEESYRTPMVSA